jgi:hypothetical protein
MRKPFILIYLALALLIIPALVSCGSEDQHTEDEEVICTSHVYSSAVVSREVVDSCTENVINTVECISCGAVAKTISQEHEHVVDFELGSCPCGEVKIVNTVIGTKEQQTALDKVLEELDKAIKNCDYDKVQECMDKIIAIQDGNFVEIHEEILLAVGSVSNATTSYDVNDVTWTVSRIRENAFATDYPYKDISCGNIEIAIKKATGFTEAELRNSYVTIAANYETNGYEFYITLRTEN